jgi:Cu/Zn superoxide dismutase
MSGELGVNIGDLANPSVSAQYTDVHLTLFGPDIIVGRSIVIHKADASRWVCATIGEARTVTATFSAAQPASGPVRGTVTFTQVETGPTVIDVALSSLAYGPNPWHVHEFPVTNDDCGTTSTGGHYNPPGHPTQGELGTNLGALANPSVSEQYVTDTLTLFGPDSIVGRSIVIHEAGAYFVHGPCSATCCARLICHVATDSGIGTPRWVCATLGEAKTVVASFRAGHSAAGPVRVWPHTFQPASQCSCGRISNMQYSSTGI